MEAPFARSAPLAPGPAAASFLLAVALLACACGAGAPAARSAAPAPSEAAAPARKKIAAIHASGSNRYTSEEIARASGLAAGEAFSTSALAAAQHRLAETGAFTEVTDLVVQTDGNVVVEFGVSDSRPFLPVLFENFDGLGSEVIQAALTRIPLYHGQLPTRRLGLIHEVRGALEDLLRQRHLPGRVTFEIQNYPAPAVVFRREAKIRAL